MATALQPGFALAKRAYQWRGLQNADLIIFHSEPTTNPSSLCYACNSIRFWNGNYKKHLRQCKDLPASALHCPLCAMLNVKVREAYGALGFDLTKYPAELSLDPIRVTAVTREGAQTGAGLMDGFKNEFLPSLGLDPAKLSPEVLSQLAEMVPGVVPQQIEREGEPEESLRPFLYFTINYFGAQDAIKLDCTLTALPGLSVLWIH